MTQLTSLIREIMPAWSPAARRGRKAGMPRRQPSRRVPKMRTQSGARLSRRICLGPTRRITPRPGRRNPTAIDGRGQPSPKTSETLPPAWRSSRPARSSSRSTMKTWAGVQAGMADDFVDRHRRRAERLEDLGAVVLAGRRRRRKVGRILERRHDLGARIPASGAIALEISAASVTSVAPCLSNPLVPSARGSIGEPGTAKTSRLCSGQARVISEPERFAASTITTPSEAGDDPVAARKIAARGAPSRKASRKWRARWEDASSRSVCSAG